MKQLKYFLYNGLLILTAYFGLGQGVEGATYCFFFMAWLLIVTAFTVYLNPELKKKARDKGRSVPMALDVLVDLAIIYLLVWNGHFITGAFFLIHSGMTADIYKEEEDVK